MNSKRNIPSGLMVLKKIMEGTSADTGTSFFESLVKTLAEILDVSGVWVTEFLKESNRLRALAFWSNGQFIKEYEYDVPGTPCEPVLQSPDEVCHIPRNVIKLFPRDPDLRPVNAVSYMGLALKDKTNSIIGHLALLDDKPMEELPEIFPIFKIFASRASAELQRLYSEKIILESEAKIQRLLNGSGEAILECDRSGKIIQANNSAINLLGIDCEKLGQLELAKYFDQISLQAINQYTQDSTASVSSVLLEEIKGLKPDGSIFPADVVLSKYTYKHQPFFALFIRNLEEKKQQENELKHLNLQTIILQEKVKANNCDKIIGSSPVLFKAIELVNQVAATDTTTIIYGETGTGKELFAQAIHQNSLRKNKMLVSLNCATLPTELIESELFGHVKGAFTGALSHREGRFMLADQGTIFLDEIGEMPLSLQAKLLRVLQEGEFEQLGSSKTQKVNVRVIAATNRDLWQEVQKGHFREDLYYRLNVFPIHIPPLRERGQDVIEIARAMIDRFSKTMKKQVAPLSELDKQALLKYHWPGNVRELQNICERSLIIAQGHQLDIGALLPSSVPDFPSPDINNEKIYSESELRELEKENILKALKKSKGKVSGKNGAAALLGLPPTTLNSRLEKLGLKKAPYTTD